MRETDLNKKATVQGYYAKRAVDYDRQKKRTWGPEQDFEIKILRKMMEALPNLEKKLVLEIGMGTGRVAIPILDNLKPWFIGLDLSKDMLQFAKKKVLAFRQRIDLLQGDADNLPFRDDLFDGMICVSVFHYFTSPEATLTEFGRVLKRLGVFAYGDVTVHEHEETGFFNDLEGKISHAHSRYYKPTEIKRIIERFGIQSNAMTTTAYRKSYSAIIEDKCKYFNLEPEAFYQCMRGATDSDKKLYGMDEMGMTLYYTLIVGTKAELPCFKPASLERP